MPVLAIRCDGDKTVGAGHVARCLPLAHAFARRGWEVHFAGRYGGLAERLLGDMPRGDLDTADAVVVDSYERQALPSVPMATVGEALRYEDAVWIDYHLDRLGDAETPLLLPGPAYAPVEPRFAGTGRAGDPIESLLVTVGASAAARERLPALIEAAERIAPRVIVADGSFTLLEVVGEIDAAVTAAGMSAYELASAGLPIVVVQIAGNQRRVVAGLTAERVAVTEVVALVPGRNRRGMELFDGRGADRAAAGLEARWALG